MTPTPLSSTLTFRRRPLARAVGNLPPLELKVLLHLALDADPRTVRLWKTHARLAEDLGFPRELLDQALHRLEHEKFIEVFPAIPEGVVAIEIWEVLARLVEAPRNLPVEPGV